MVWPEQVDLTSNKSTMAAAAAVATSSLFSVAGKNVLVTGGSRGIGLMIAKGFIDHGANVLLTSRSEDACREASAEIGCQHYVSSNVSTRAGCEQLAEHTAKVFDNKLHILINNAGTSWGEPLERTSSPKSNWGFDRVLDLVSKSRLGIFQYKRDLSSFICSNTFCFYVYRHYNRM